MGKKNESYYISKTAGLSVIISGVGKAFAIHSLMEINNSCDVVLSLGTSAGIGNCSIADLFLCRQFVEYDMDVTGIGVEPGITPFSGMKSAYITTKIDTELEKKILQACSTLGYNVMSGISASADRFIDNEKVSLNIKNTFKADAADMESAAIAKICAFRLNKHYAALRYISDKANKSSSTDWSAEVEKASKVFHEILRQLVFK
jgi:adenosylhomocysteine/aminodeoxyfutalosine nucleosidase